MPELNAIRCFAAFWVVAFHLDGYVGFNSELIRRGPVAVDLFFILSGFVMAHVYLEQVREGGFSYRRFIVARLARLYPLHLAVLAMFGVAVIGAGLTGVSVNQSFPVEDLPAHLAMIHGWGFLDHLSWNGPSWSISAEWFAYLVFPVSAGLLLWFSRSPAAGVIAAIMAGTIVYVVLGTFNGTPLTARTWNLSILRIIPEFIGGGALYLAGRQLRLPLWLAGLIAGMSTVLIVALAYGGANAVWIIAAGALVILMAAEIARADRPNVLRWKPLVYLGEISYSIYMVHILAFLVLFKVVAVDGWIAAIIALACVIGFATLTYHFIEVPGRSFARRLGDRKAHVPA